MIQQFT